ncbi:MAG: type II secretion system F family protein [Candidatus Micrarchaeota archaeon]|nr:type II secretion system F family protein [Candidatus Micrarchaeota archaeon]
MSISDQRNFLKVIERLIRQNLVYANLDISITQFYLVSTFMFVVGFLLGFLILSLVFTQTSPILVGLVTGILCFIAPFGYILFVSDYRKRALEDSASEALLLIAASLRAGTTLEGAISSTSRHRFGPIKEELEKTSKELILGTRMEEALFNITKRTNSSLMKNIVMLWIYGMKAGGNMADILNNLAFEAKAFQLLREEIEAQTNTVKIMIVLIVLFLAPAMLAAATNYLIVTKSFNEMFKENFKGVKSIGSVSSGGALINNMLLQAITNPASGSNINIQDIINFSYLLCIMSSFTGGALIGILATGDYKAGIKYIPIFLIASILVYYVTLNLMYDQLKDVFGGNLRFGPDGKLVEIVHEG